MKCRFIMMFVFLASLAYSACLAIAPDEITLGIMISGIDQARIGLSDSLLHTLTDSLGFNFVYLTAPDTGVALNIRQAYYSHGLDVIPYLTDPIDRSLDSAFQNYLTAHYMLTQAKDQSSEIRFKYRNMAHGHDSTLTDWFVADVYSDSFIFLDDFWYNHLWKYMDYRMDYVPALYMRLDTNSVVADTYQVVAYLNVWKANSNPWEEQTLDRITDTQDRHATLQYRDSIMVSDFDSAGYPRYIDKPYMNCPPCDNFDDDFLTYQIVSTGKFSFAIDTFKVSNDRGRALMRGDYDSRFASYCSQHQNDSTILYWQLKDDMRTDEIMPARKIDSLIIAGTGGADEVRRIFFRYMCNQNFRTEGKKICNKAAIVK